MRERVSKEAESGRSILEMLGVLAVLVVLTLGGIHVFGILYTQVVSKALTDYVVTQASVRRHEHLKTVVERKGNVIDIEGPYGYMVHIEDGMEGTTLANDFWVTISLSGGLRSPKKLCDKLLAQGSSLKKMQAATSASANDGQLLGFIELYVDDNVVENCNDDVNFVKYVFAKRGVGIRGDVCLPGCPPKLCPVGATCEGEPCENRTIECNAGYKKIHAGTCSESCRKCEGREVCPKGEDPYECPVGQKANADHTACECCTPENTANECGCSYPLWPNKSCGCGCASDEDCKDNKVCDTTTGICVCNNESTCGTNEWWNRAKCMCERMDVVCKEDADCSKGYHCISTACLKGKGSNAKTCAPECETAEGCPDGWICAEGDPKICKPGCCTTDADCSEGYHCISTTCSEGEENSTKTCVPECEKAESCSEGWACPEGDPRVCKPCCTEDKDCPEGMICDPETKKCITNTCEEDEDCEGNMICDPEKKCTCPDGSTRSSDKPCDCGENQYLSEDGKKCLPCPEDATAKAGDNACTCTTEGATWDKSWNVCSTIGLECGYVPLTEQQWAAYIRWCPRHTAGIPAAFSEFITSFPWPCMTRHESTRAMIRASHEWTCVDDKDTGERVQESFGDRWFVPTREFRTNLSNLCLCPVVSNDPHELTSTANPDFVMIQEIHETCGLYKLSDAACHWTFSNGRHSEFGQIVGSPRWDEKTFADEFLVCGNCLNECDCPTNAICRANYCHCPNGLDYDPNKKACVACPVGSGCCPEGQTADGEGHCVKCEDGDCECKIDSTSDSYTPVSGNYNDWLGVVIVEGGRRLRCGTRNRNVCLWRCNGNCTCRASYSSCPEGTTRVGPICCDDDKVIEHADYSLECCEGEISINEIGSPECCVPPMVVQDGVCVACANGGVPTRCHASEGYCPETGYICCDAQYAVNQAGVPICCDGADQQVVEDGANRQCCDNTKVAKAENDDAIVCCSGDDKEIIVENDEKRCVNKCSDGEERMPDGSCCLTERIAEKAGEKMCCAEDEHVTPFYEYSEVAENSAIENGTTCCPLESGVAGVYSCCGPDQEVVAYECVDKCREDQVRGWTEGYGLICKCPDDQEEHNGVCEAPCAFPMEWDGEDSCMCPEGVTPTEYEGKQYCCRNGGEYSAEGCDDDVFGLYCRPNVEVCGCPDGRYAEGEYKGCCRNGGYDDGKSDRWNFYAQNAEACPGMCLEGTYTQNDAGFACCNQDGLSITKDSRGETFVEESTVCCPGNSYASHDGYTYCCPDYGGFGRLIFHRRNEWGGLAGTYCCADYGVEGMVGYDECCLETGGYFWIEPAHGDVAAKEHGTCCDQHNPGYDDGGKWNPEECGCPSDTDLVYYQWDEKSPVDYVCCKEPGVAIRDGQTYGHGNACGCGEGQEDLGRSWGTDRLCCPKDLVNNYTDSGGAHSVCCNDGYGHWDYSKEGCCRAGKNGEIGTPNKGICCYDGYEWNEEDEEYNILNVRDCGVCPNKGTSTQNGCCLGGWYLDPEDPGPSDNPYSKINAAECLACPSTVGYNTVRWATNGSASACCTEDGYEVTDTGTISMTATKLCCPRADTSSDCCRVFGGTPSTSNTSVCCSMRGYKMLENNTSTVADYAACGCPTGAHNSYVTGQTVCCSDSTLGHKVLEDGTSVADYASCGCPTGAHSSSAVEGVCCSDSQAGFEVLSDSSMTENYQACGCPYAQYGEPANYNSSYNVCCAGGYVYNGGGYYDINTAACGCPSGFSPMGGNLGSNICCSESSYSLGAGQSSQSPDYEHCGCPYDGATPGELKDGVCCLWGFAYEGGSLYSAGSYSGENTVCCPGGYVNGQCVN